jgi:Cu+-exporting ATPase
METSMHTHEHHHAAATAPASVTRDPVCGMTVDPDAGKPTHEHEGHIYHFCSNGCREKFGAEPEKYLEGRPAPEPMPEGTVYTCPMHPEIERVGPGDCPLCGMALEPKGVPTGDEGPNPELVDFRRRFAIGAALTVPLLILTMGPYLGLPVREWIGERLTLWIELALGTPVILWSGWPFLVDRKSVV